MDREVWNDIKEYKGIYQVSNMGNVRSLDRLVKNKYSARLSKGRALKQYLSHRGYFRVKLYKNEKGRILSVHRLVAEAFLGYSPLTVDHKDTNKINNRVSNLHYMTHSDNLKKYHTSEQFQIDMQDKRVRTIKNRLKTLQNIKERVKGEISLWSPQFSDFKKEPNKKQKMVAQIDTANLNIVNIFSAIMNTEEYGYKPSAVYACCYGRRVKHHNNHWFFIENPFNKRR